MRIIRLEREVAERVKDLVAILVVRALMAVCWGVVVSTIILALMYHPREASVFFWAGGIVFVFWALMRVLDRELL